MDLKHSIEDYQKACGRTIAFALAPQAGTSEHLFDAGKAACRAQVAAVFLLADSACAEDAVEAMRNLQRKGRGALVQAMELDYESVYGDIESGAGFNLEELPLNFLQVMRSLSESVLDIYDSILIMDASQPAPEPQALYDMALQLGSGPSAGDMVRAEGPGTSPFLISRAYVERLEDFQN